MKFGVKELKLLGASLYLCEGTKLRTLGNGRKIYSIEFTNNDPRTIQIFLKFLRKIIKPVESRVKVQLFIYPDLDEVFVAKYWQKVTKIPKSRFNKTICLKGNNSKGRHSPFGTVKLRYAHKEHFLVLQSIIDEVFGGVRISTISSPPRFANPRIS